jgi:hypothetical protein
MPEDTPGEEQRTMLSFAEAADRLVKDDIAQSMTAEGLRRLARDPHSGWPIGPDDYRVVGKTRMLPYEVLAPYMRARKPGRGPAKEPRKKRRPQPDQQGGPEMAVYTLTMRIEADPEVTPEQIRQEIYDACPNVPFGFDITSIEGEQ